MSRINWLLLLPALVLMIVSLATFYSLDKEIFRQQFIFLFVAVVFYMIFLYFPSDFYRYYSRFFYFGILLLLFLIFFIGIEARGSIRWVEFFGIRIQFSEILKPFFILYFASFITIARVKNFFSFLKGMLLFIPIFFLILKQPDLGSASIYFFALLPMFVMGGFSILYLIIFAVVLVIPLPIAFNLLHDYQKERIYSFLNYTQDPFGSSYNIVQSMISVGSGGLFGKGFGHATQSTLRFLPERHTDFIFATISETLGFVGGILIIFFYVFLLYRIYLIAKNAVSLYMQVVGFGFFFLLTSHILFNIGMNMGILPVVGVTLPFLSYGGSSLVSNFIILGILSSFSNESSTRP